MLLYLLIGLCRVLPDIGNFSDFAGFVLGWEFGWDFLFDNCFFSLLFERMVSHGYRTTISLDSHGKNS